MIETVKEIGLYKVEHSKKSSLELLAQDFTLKGYNTFILFVVVKKVEDAYVYVGIDGESYEPSLLTEYLYKKGSPRGVNFSPTSIIAKDLKKTFSNKFQGWFDYVIKKGELSERSNRALCGINNVLLDENQVILDDLEAYYQTDKILNGAVLSLKIIENNETFYCASYKPIIEGFHQLIKKMESVVFSKNQVCAVCNERKERVIGDCNVFKFYTIDKIGFVSGGFKKNEAWKNYPVCQECKFYLEQGKQFVEEHLIYNICGINFYIIPKPLLYYDEAYSQLLNEMAKYNEEYKSSLDEKELFEFLSCQSERYLFDFIYIKKQQAAEKILEYIDYVNVADLQRLTKSIKKTRQQYYKDFSFKTIRKFYLQSDNNSNLYDLDNYFLKVIKQIIKHQGIDEFLLFKFLMNNIRAAFREDYYFHKTVKEAFAVYSFLRYNKDIEQEVARMNMTAEERLFDHYFDELGASSYDSLKKGLIILGTLNELLLRRQYNFRDAKPYMKQLKSLRMAEKDFKGLLPRVQNKLEEYGSFDQGKRLLAKEAANYLLRSGDDWQLSTDELNFYFAAGMNLADEIMEVANKDR